MSNPPVSINLAVLNGEKYIQYFLDSVLAQTYPHKLIEFNILDNGSSDKTKEIAKETRDKRQETRNFAKFFLLESKKNLGMWPGQEELLKYTHGKYVVTAAVDIILDKDFIKNVVEIMEKDKKIGVLQPKIYKFDIASDIQDSRFQTQKVPRETLGLLCGIPDSKILDTCGFKIFRSRRIINIGHGEKDIGQYDDLGEIFAVEGAVPVFRKEALESCRIKIPDSRFQIPDSEIADHDYFWYGDDLDLTWRMRLFGWKEIFAPRVIAWHDRQTTKTLKTSWLDYFSRIPTRRQIPIKKRRLDWRNNRWTLIKNDYIINVLKDLPWIICREIAVIGYSILFEPEVTREVPTFFKYLPKMLRKRKEIMKRVIVSSKEMRKWIN